MKLAEDHLNVIQMKIDTRGYDDALFEQQKLANINYQKALDLEEVFWKEKSKVQ